MDSTKTFIVPVDLAEFGRNGTRVESVNLRQHVIQKLPLVNKHTWNAFVCFEKILQCCGVLDQPGALGFNSVPDSLEDPLNHLGSLGLLSHIAKLVYRIENAVEAKVFVKFLNDATHVFDAEHALPDHDHLFDIGLADFLTSAPVASLLLKRLCKFGS